MGFPKGLWGVAYTFEAPLIKRGVVDFAAGADYTAQAGDVKVLKDGGSPASIGTLPSAVASGNGSVWSFALSAAEMQATSRVVVTVIDAATKAVEDTEFIIEVDYGVRSNTAQAGASGSITLDASASAVNDFYRGLSVEIISGAGAGQKRLITAYNGSTRVATVQRAWATTPDSTSIFRLQHLQEVDVASWLATVPNALQSGRVDGYVGAYASGQAPLQPTVAGRTVDVSAGGEVGLDWANIGSPSTVVNLAGTTIKTASDVEADTQDLQDRTPAALVNGRMDASVGEYQSGQAPLQPTVAGRTVDVAATGEMGLDFDNVKQASLATTLTNITVPVVSTVNALGTQAKADVNAEADTALADYGPLKPTVAGRTLDVSPDGEAGVDWSNVGSPSAVVSLAGTTIKTATDVESDTAAIQAVTDKLDTALEQDGAVYRYTANALEQAPAGGGGGAVTGTYTVTVTVVDDTSSDPLPTALVTLKTAGGTLYDQGRADNDGEFVSAADDGSYTATVSPLPGYSAVVDQAFTMNGADTAVEVRLARIAADAPAAGTRLVRYILIGEDGAPVEGAAVTARLRNRALNSIDQALMQFGQQTATTDENGIADFTCVTEDLFEDGDGVYIFKAPNVPDIALAIPAGDGVLNLQEATRS